MAGQGARVPAEWARNQASAPYRASVRGKARLDENVASPDLVACSRRLPGGRILFAFEAAELRDLFVASHYDQGARLEADGFDGQQGNGASKKAR